MSSPIFCKSELSDIYIVKTDPENSRHRGLHSNPSQYVLTFRPNPGDQIEFVLPGRKYAYLRIIGLHSWRVLSWNYSLGLISEGKTSRHKGKKKIVISSCPGYGCMMGEDTWDDGVDQPILKDLIREAIGPFSDCGWLYAPVTITELEPSDSSAPSCLYYRITSEGGCALIGEEQFRQRDEFAEAESAKVDFEDSQEESLPERAIGLSTGRDDAEEEMNWEED